MLRLFERLLHATWRRAVLARQARFDRVLPYGDYFSDRWEKAALLGFGAGSSIYDSALVFGSVSVGEQVWIGPFTVLDGTGGLRIGSHCNISAGCQIYSHDSIDRCVSGGTAPLAQAPVSIGARTYIGPNTVVVKGVRIGEGCVIGANSLVLDDIPDGMMAAGTPCRIIRPVAIAGSN